jgi:hypothetical protein
MQSQAAGIVVFRGQNDELEFLLVARRSLSLSLSLSRSLSRSLSLARAHCREYPAAVLPDRA